MSNPWMKFYPRDWRGDQALRSVSIAARGLWIECLCIMHEAVPYGHLLVNGVPVEGDTLARISGTSVDEVSALIAELRQAGVLSVTRKGVVFSRRMVRDHARANKGRKAVKGRWERELAESAPENRAKDGTTGLGQVPDNASKTSSPNRSPNRSPITQKPEARDKHHSDVSMKGAREKTSTPRKELEFVLDADHADAIIEHRKILRKPLTARAARLLASEFAKTGNPNAAADRMIANGWQGFRADWVPRDQTSTAMQPAQPQKQRDPAMWRKGVILWLEDGRWLFGHEPTPDDPKTEVPPDVLDEFCVSPGRHWMDCRRDWLAKIGGRDAALKAKADLGLPVARSVVAA